ncbi:MAG: leucyl aminopeptidase family protein [Gammaproteobacteria bacterium]
MLECFTATVDGSAVPIIPVARNDYPAWLKRQSETRRLWLTSAGFDVADETPALVPGECGALEAVIVGVESAAGPWPFGALPMRLPAGDYHIVTEGPIDAASAALGWGLGAYRFERYKSFPRELPRLVLTDGVDSAAIDAQVRAAYLVRDLINTSAADMMPAQLAEAAAWLADEFGAQIQQIVGDELLAGGYPAIHAVGRASVHAPRLIDVVWGQTDHPKVTLVGKGACFDSGGLDIKSASGMRIMKKDMGGAAHALGLAYLVMASKLPIRLRVLVPAVENAISGNAFRPGDVLATRKGLSVEVDNTDAEGRLVLCDALAEAAAESPALVIDFATLTGAARIALGTELPGFFTASESIAEGIVNAASRAHDPVWRLPLHAPYRALLESDIADLVNASPEPYGGAIIAALFLQAFVPADINWLHFDVMAWNLRARPGRPRGGEAMGMRAVFEYLCQRFPPHEA